MPESAPRDRSPFADLSFAEQQEQWRIFRAQKLDFQTIAPPAPARTETPPRAAPGAAVRALPPPSHKNLDRVRAQLSAAVKKAGAFQTTSNA